MTFKVKATMTIEVVQEIEAISEEEAIDTFYKQSLSDVIDDANYIEEIDSDIDQIEVYEAKFKVKTTEINYDVDYYTCSDIVAEEHPDMDEYSEEFDQLVYAKIDEIKKSLPQELEFEIECERENLDDYVADAVSEETGWLVNYCEYTVLESK